MWSDIWRQGGFAAMQDRWFAMDAAMAKRQPSRRKKFLSYAFWVVIALGLVFYFNFKNS